MIQRKKMPDIYLVRDLFKIFDINTFAGSYVQQTESCFF